MQLRISIRMEIRFKCGSLIKGLVGFDLPVNSLINSLSVCLGPICKNNLIGMEFTGQPSLLLFYYNFLTLISCFVIWFELDRS